MVYLAFTSVDSETSAVSSLQEGTILLILFTSKKTVEKYRSPNCTKVMTGSTIMGSRTLAYGLSKQLNLRFPLRIWNQRQSQKRDLHFILLPQRSPTVYSSLLIWRADQMFPSGSYVYSFATLQMTNLVCENSTTACGMTTSIHGLTKRNYYRGKTGNLKSRRQSVPQMLSSYAFRATPSTKLDMSKKKS